MLTYRPLQPSETELLKTFIYEAIFIPEGVEPPPFDIIFRPEIALYYEGFGNGSADNCIVAEIDGKVVGTVWTRIMNDCNFAFKRISQSGYRHWINASYAAIA